ncbi:MAG: hypothetical protein K0R36_1110 [Chryseobacterium sp.]|jgi:CDP-diglyceride synthetase|uniref:hypothetical protein n=1 Tax=Chryseobacterium sp. TaxID=1871047 RepID=UPI0026068675|nr:hypothetical protein [Chryseobacterium sp.]MDF2551165.1 hypothetical protein [Chryseobacterium sp.]MDF2931779.1 hypothetical protein [Chryseobacterium sp.]
MKNNKLSDLSSEQLASKKKTMTGAIIGLSIVLFIACSILFYLAVTDKNITLIPIAICCLLTLLPSFIGMSQINAEIRSRKSKYTK